MASGSVDQVPPLILTFLSWKEQKRGRKNRKSYIECMIVAWWMIYPLVSLIPTYEGSRGYMKHP